MNRTLKNAGRNATLTPGMRIWTGGFLTVQLALAMILFAQVVVAAYIANQDIPTDANINTTDVVTGSITLPVAVIPYRRSTPGVFRSSRGAVEGAQ